MKFFINSRYQRCKDFIEITEYNTNYRQFYMKITQYYEENLQNNETQLETNFIIYNIYTRIWYSCLASFFSKGSAENLTGSE